MVHVLQTTQNLVISRCLLAEDGKEMYQDSKRTRTLLFCSLNLLFNLVTFPLPLPSWFRKRPTGFTTPTSGKNRKYLCIHKKKLENIFKNWLCPNLPSCPKNLSYPNFWGGWSPPRPAPPARTPMGLMMHDEIIITLTLTKQLRETGIDILQTSPICSRRH